MQIICLKNNRQPIKNELIVHQEASMLKQIKSLFVYHASAICGIKNPAAGGVNNFSNIMDQ